MAHGAFAYGVRGRRVVLQPSGVWLAVRFREPALHSIRARVAKETGIGPFSTRFEIPNEKFTLFRTSGADESPPAPAQVQARLAGNGDVSRAAPVYRVGEVHVVATDRVSVGFRGSGDAVERAIVDLGGRVIERHENAVVVRLGPEQDPIAFTDAVSRVPGVQFAEPDFVTISPRPQPLPEGIASRSALARGSYPLGVIRADRARELVSGTPDITIAILDDGADALHAALAPAVTQTYDALLDAALTGPNPWDGHGTACAGLAAAAGGIVPGFFGVAAGCSLMLVRIAQSAYRGGPWVTTNSCIRRGIDWAVDHGADVINNSWGGGPPSNLVIEALERAREVGRGGRGTVLVVAAGNDAAPVDYPGSLAGVLTIAGTNQWDEPKTPSSEDGEVWWGSNFGPEVDLAAPSVRLRTTDVRGAGGFEATDYTDTFNGTSAAAPLVAGAAALVLSANPSLAERDVRDLLCRTASKVGALPYDHGRNDRCGFGRLDVFAAVTAARATGSGAVIDVPRDREAPGSGTVGEGAIPPGEIRMGYVEMSSEDDGAVVPEPRPPAEGSGVRAGTPPPGEIWLGYVEEEDTAAGAPVEDHAVTCIPGR